MSFPLSAKLQHSLYYTLSHSMPTHQLLVNPKLRNEALEPLLSGNLSRKAAGNERPVSAENMASGQGIVKRPESNRVVFLNDVFFCAQHLLRLVMHGQVGRRASCMRIHVCIKCLLALGSKMNIPERRALRCKVNQFSKFQMGSITERHSIARTSSRSHLFPFSRT